MIIFGLGIFLAGFPFGLLFGHQFSFENIRIPGVLQRIAICYLIASAIFLWTSLRAQIAWIVGLLAAYWLMVKLIPVPGYGAGVMQAQGGLCWWVDSTVLAGHTWRGAPVMGFDPEGIVSTIPAIATTLFGVMMGHWLRSKRSAEEKTVWMFVAGELLMLIGAILDMWLPINKNLWTSSYVIFMAGWASVIFAMFYWLIDVKGYKKWALPFNIYGMNAITVFVLSGLLAKTMGLVKVTQDDGTLISLQRHIYTHIFVPIASPLNASLLYAICFIGVMFIVVWLMWRMKWFLKV